MNETWGMALALALGAAMGVVFFGGLWWTIRKGVASNRPSLWFFGSLILRIGFVAAGFYLLPGRHWGRLLACLLGFMAARFGIIRLTRTSTERPCRDGREATHAP